MSKYRHKTLFYIHKIDENGLPVISDKKKHRMRAEIKERFADSRVEVTIKPAGKEKTLKQLGYYYGVILPYICYGLIKAGNDFNISHSADLEEIDIFLKEMFLKNGIELHTLHGEVIKGRSSLSASSKQETMDYLDDVIKFGTEDLGVDIPAPDENHEGKTVKEYLSELLDESDKHLA